ncbi:MAG: AbrB/MazE/SpoVT family DNA-binding domain-containing protein [Candidatus Woesearchaeota archaeon]
MKRRIIKQGHNTLTLTLPAGWVKKLNLKSGDEIDILEKENTLIINSACNHKDKSCEIDIRGFSVPLLWRYVQSAYRSGCDEIKIYFDSSIKEYEDAYHYYTTQFEYSKLGEKIPPKPAIAMIQDITNRFIGVDIVESGNGYCIIKEMAEVSSKEFENSLRRIFLVILQLFDIVIEAIEKDKIRESSLCKEIHTIDLTVDKLVDYCSRILNKISTEFPENKKALMFSSLFILELIGDEFKYIGKHLALTQHSVKEVVKLAKMNRQHFESYYKLYYSFDRKKAITFGEGDFEVYEANYKMKNKLQDDSRSIAKHLMMVSKLTLALTELRIQMEF